ncbi:MAG: bifunctional phosphopantothenoylcysteine decarboxylase/phosphopantothenate--cysteine ligase CoaBC [Acidimicrobiales bacterium]|nr:bifunctional phosphopantothenoylcysteine decarboxylase/phosphopantothenate--cysteine ligase CoaBC [Acidimicrobiales bacterium]
MLEGKRVVLGVAGGIAAYKAIDVCRRLVDAGAHVVPVLTEGALHFVGRTTFDALGSERAWTSLWDEQRPIPHTHLGQTADLVIVAPATARVLGLYATGISDDLLTNILLATRAPVLVCPAMHTEMWEHAAVQDNLRVLRGRGVHVVEPEVGRLAGGDVGAGRLADPATIVEAATSLLLASASAPDLTGLRMIVTAGGTREPIDPVRFIGNRSSGKQGHAVAEEAAARGAKVTLVTTVRLPVSARIDAVRVDTAAEMEHAVLSRAESADVVVMAAAVADFRPVQAAPSKLKKAGGPPEVRLEPTVDILAELGGRRRPGQVLVGFAAETDDLRVHAAEKLQRKGIDLIVGNDISEPGVGFEHDTNAVVILGADGSSVEVPLADKRAIARAILDAISNARSSS